MNLFAYVVQAELESEALRDRYVEWLVGGHAREVCEAGASSCEVVVLDGAPLRVESRYLFASREAFAAYERDHAPRLREEGRARFPSGLTFARRTGDVALELRGPSR